MLRLPSVPLLTTRSFDRFVTSASIRNSIRDLMQSRWELRRRCCSARPGLERQGSFQWTSPAMDWIAMRETASSGCFYRGAAVVPFSLQRTIRIWSPRQRSARIPRPEWRCPCQPNSRNLPLSSSSRDHEPRVAYRLTGIFSPRLARSVRPSYSVRNSPRRRNSGNSRVARSSSPPG